MQKILCFGSRISQQGLLLVALITSLLLVSSYHASADDAEQSRPVEVVVGNLVYGDGQTSRCFAPGFLETVDRETDANVAREFTQVDLASDELFAHPFVIMTGENAFTLTEAQKKNLRSYLEQGGFLLASAGCSNAEWAKSFEAQFASIFSGDALKPLATDHPLFHTIYDIDTIDVRNAADNAIFGMSIEGALRVVYSPLGLNDTGNAGKGCCCCGGNEVRNARLINANILAYALSH